MNQRKYLFLKRYRSSLNFIANDTYINIRYTTISLRPFLLTLKMLIFKCQSDSKHWNWTNDLPAIQMYATIQLGKRNDLLGFWTVNHLVNISMKMNRKEHKIDRWLANPHNKKTPFHWPSHSLSLSLAMALFLALNIYTRKCISKPK